MADEQKQRTDLFNKQKITQHISDKQNEQNNNSDCKKSHFIVPDELDHFQIVEIMTLLTQYFERLWILELLITEQKVIIDGEVHLYFLFACK